MGTLAGALAWQGHAGSGSGIARAIACQRPVFDLRAQPPDFSLPAAVYLDKKVQEIVEKKMELKRMYRLVTYSNMLVTKWETPLRHVSLRDAHANE